MTTVTASAISPSAKSIALALDHVRWAEILTVRSFGLRFGVRVSDEALLARVIEHLPPGTRGVRRSGVEHLYSIWRDPANRRLIRLYSGAKQVLRTSDDRLAWARFASIVRADVASAAKGWVFVHAGVVTWNDRAIVIPAPSGHGKSQLVAALLRAGATYYSDEFAVIDGRGQVHPFPKLISLKNSDGSARLVRAADLGGPTGTSPAPVGLVVLTRFANGAVWAPRSLSAADAMLALLPNTFQARTAPRRVLRRLARLLDGVTAIQGPRGDADDIAGSLMRMVE